MTSDLDHEAQRMPRLPMQERYEVQPGSHDQDDTKELNVMVSLSPEPTAMSTGTVTLVQRITPIVHLQMTLICIPHSRPVCTLSSFRVRGWSDSVVHNSEERASGVVPFHWFGTT